MAIVSRIERKANVNLRYNGVDCWPVVRNTFMSMVSHGVTKRSQKLSLSTCFSAVIDLIYLWFRSDKAYAVIMTDFKYQVKLHGRGYFKDASVISELLNASGKKCHIFTQGIATTADDPGRSRSVYFLIALTSVTARILMRLDFGKQIPQYLRDIYNIPEFDSLIPNAQNNISQIKRNIYFVIVASYFFQFLLKRIRPKKCFIVCYYSCLGMALCVACRRLDIESVDLQHGVSGFNMRAYGQWNKLPDQGFNTLPQTFYCWTPMDVSAINDWACDNPHHRSLLTGSLWRQYLVETETLLLPEELELKKKVTGNRKILLFTARNSDFPQLIIKLLEQAPKDYFFLIRMHPDTPAEELYILSEQLKRINPACSLINATKVRIHLAMQLADLHITEWSAAVYDAFYEDTPSLVITEVGKDYFEDFIRKGYVFYAKDLKKLVENIEWVVKKEKSYDKTLTLQELRELIEMIA